MRIVDAAQTARLLPYSPLARAIEDMLRLHAQGKVDAPPRHHIPLPGDGTLLVMPARGEKIAMTKTVTVHPENKAHGLPCIQGEVLVMDARDGTRLAVLDGIVLTARRTAALSLLAAQKLAPNPKGPALVFGAGAQARSHLLALKEGLDIYQAFVCARTTASAQALADDLVRHGIMIKPVDDPAEVLPLCPIIVTATTSHTPVLSEQVRDDAMIIAVGAYRPDMAEIPPELVHRCTVFDDTDEALYEAGDLIQAGMTTDDVTPLALALDLDTPPRGPVLFKSTGHSMFDLAAARMAVERLNDEAAPETG